MASIPKISINKILLVIVFSLLFHVVAFVYFQRRITTARLNLVQQEIDNKIDLLKKRISYDFESLEMGLFDKTKNPLYPEDGTDQKAMLVAYLNSVKYLKSISVANTIETKEIIRINNKSFLCRGLTQDNKTIDYTPINIDSNRIQFMETNSIKDSTMVNSKWLYKTIESGKPFYFSFLQEDTVTQTNLISVSKKVISKSNEVLGLKVDISLQGFYNFFGPLVKETTLLVTDKNGGHCYFCNEQDKCSPFNRCKFCTRFEKEFYKTEDIKKGKRYSYYAFGNINSWKAVTYDFWGREISIAFSVRNSLLKIVLEHILGIGSFLLLTIILLYILKRYKYLENKKFTHLSKGSATENGSKTEEIDLSDKQIETFKNDIEKMICGKEHYDPNYSIGRFSEKYNYPRELVNQLCLQITKKTFSALLNEERIKSSIKIIIDEQQKIISIDHLLEEVGFSSKTSFYREFKNYTGKPPKEYINSVFQKESE